jgi:hypothetical protein
LRQELQQDRTATATAQLALPAQPSSHQSAAAAHSGSSSNRQKKGGGGGSGAGQAGGAWAAALGTPALQAGGFDAVEAEAAAADEATAGSRRAPRQELVVVASLLSKAPNLAGLARTCEVFGWVGGWALHSCLRVCQVCCLLLSGWIQAASFAPSSLPGCSVTAS